jgi:hypothetical protein
MERYLAWGVMALGIGVAHAATLQMSRAELCELSSKVLVGEVSSQETRWSAGGSGAIERVVWVSVSTDVKGQPSSSVEVVLPGGELEGVAHWVEDSPRLIENGRYLLFLQAIEGRWFVTGGEQGAVRLTPHGARVGETDADALSSVGACNVTR